MQKHALSAARMKLPGGLNKHESMDWICRKMTSTIGISFNKSLGQNGQCHEASIGFGGAWLWQC